MKILFIGAVQFSARALRELLSLGADVVGVCTLKESKFNADHFDLTPVANRYGLPVLQESELNEPQSISWIQNLHPDVAFCFGWSRLIRQPLLGLPPMGVIGFHPAALPANRGRHPIVWALVLGLSQTASTFFFMDEGADTGDILSQTFVPIAPTDDAGELYERITQAALGQLHEFLPKLAAGTFTRQPQNSYLANSWRKRNTSDGRIDWRMAAESIHNLVRGLARPYEGAHFDFGGNEIKVWKAGVEENVPLNLEPGKVLAVTNKDILVKTGVGAIRLQEIWPKISVKVGSYL